MKNQDKIIIVKAWIAFSKSCVQDLEKQLEQPDLSFDARGTLYFHKWRYRGKLEALEDVLKLLEEK